LISVVNSADATLIKLANFLISQFVIDDVTKYDMNWNGELCSDDSMIEKSLVTTYNNFPLDQYVCVQTCGLIHWSGSIKKFD
jgi:hypothetical protein